MIRDFFLFLPPATAGRTVDFCQPERSPLPRIVRSHRIRTPCAHDAAPGAANGAAHNAAPQNDTDVCPKATPAPSRGHLPGIWTHVLLGTRRRSRLLCPEPTPPGTPFRSGGAVPAGHLAQQHSPAPPQRRSSPIMGSILRQPLSPPTRQASLAPFTAQILHSALAKQRRNA